MKSIATYRCRHCLAEFDRTYNDGPNAAFYYAKGSLVDHVCAAFKPDNERMAPLGYGVAEMISIRRHGA